MNCRIRNSLVAWLVVMAIFLAIGGVANAQSAGEWGEEAPFRVVSPVNMQHLFTIYYYPSMGAPTNLFFRSLSQGVTLEIENTDLGPALTTGGLTWFFTAYTDISVPPANRAGFWMKHKAGKIVWEDQTYSRGVLTYATQYVGSPPTPKELPVPESIKVQLASTN